MSKSYANISDLVNALSHDNQVNKFVDEELKKNKAGVYDEKVLAKYANELRSMILENLDTYYTSYNPIVHERTMQLMDMFNKVTVSQENGKALITFNDNAYQINAVKSQPHESFVPLLLNYGWNLGGSIAPRPRSLFEYYEGNGFITNAIEEFNAKYGSHGVVAEFIF